jgi:DNA-binding CsgD family transcriptional regulator
MKVNAAAQRYKSGDMGSRDLLRIVEAAYWVDGTDAEWLERVGEACRPALDEGFGLCVFQFQHQLGSPPQILRAAKVGIPEPLAALYGEVFRRLEPGVQVRPFTHGPCTTGSQMMGQREEFRENEHMKRHVHQFGMYDSLWITAAEPSGSGCGIHSGRPEVGWVSRSFREHWARVASHLAAGVRLRRRLQSTLEPPQVEAVLEPSGKLVHAEGPATEPEAIDQLRRAVLAVEQARGPSGSSDVMTSLDSWQGLIDARWSLLDQFESDGRRFIVARENAPRPPGPAALTQRERQVLGYAAVGHDNKVIAYDLGIAHATVKVLMSRAATKLGVRSRSEVISAYLNACGSAPAAP